MGKASLWAKSDPDMKMDPLTGLANSIFSKLSELVCIN